MGIAQSSGFKKRAEPSIRRHQRRGSMASGAADFLAQLAAQVIILVLLLGSFRHDLEPGAARGVAGALKLPAFLSSWMPHQQHNQQQSADELSGDYSTNSLAFAGLETVGARPAGNSAASSKQVSGRNRGHSKRPFQSMLPGAIAKHPAGHLFASLPKSLFGRILSTNSGQASKHQQQQQLQQVALSGAKFRLANPGGQMLWPHIRQKQQQQQQQQQPLTLNKELVVANYNGQSYRFPAVQLGAGGAQLVAKLMQSSSDLPITSFRPAPAMSQNQAFASMQQVVQASNNGGGQQAEQQQHALGYGEQDDDFVIVNAQQVPELQQGQPVGPVRQQQAAGSNSDEEYREMPAIVISEGDIMSGGDREPTGGASLAGHSHTSQSGLNSTTANGSRTSGQDWAKTLQGQTTTGQQEGGELVRLQAPTAEQHENEATSKNETIGSTGGATSQSNDSSNSIDSRAKPEANQNQSAAPIESQNSTSALDFADSSRNQTMTLEPGAVQIGADSPENNRQESAAKAVVVPSMGQRPNQNQLHGQPEETLESFILGPYKGLSLGDDLPTLNQMDFQDSQRQPMNGPQYLGQFQRPQQQQQHQLRASNLIGSASSLVQQARQLIQLPFAHLPGGSHFLQLHQQQRPSQHLYDYMPATSISRPGNLLNPYQHNRWPSNLPQSNQFLAASQAQAMPSLDLSAYQRNQHSLGMPRPAYNFHSGKFSNFNAYSNQQPPRGAFANTLAISHGGNPAQAIQQQQQQQQQRSPPEEFASQVLPSGGQRQHQAASYQQAHLDAPPFQHIDNDLQQLLNMSELNPGRLLKSGLYQVEPPKFSNADSSSGSSEQRKLAPNEEDQLGFSGELQQQKVEQAAGQEQEENSEAANDEQDGGDKPDGPQQASAPVSVPVGPISADSEANKRANETGSQVLQVGASFGVSESNSSSASQRGTKADEARKGQVFSEPIGAGQSAGGPARVGPRQWLDTQVFTLPYGGGAQAEFGPLSMRSVPMGWNIQQQLPVTFISASSPEGGQTASRPGASSWSSSRRQTPPQTVTDDSSAQAEDEQQRNEVAPAVGTGGAKGPGRRLQYFHFQSTRGNEQASGAPATPNPVEGDEKVAASSESSGGGSNSRPISTPAATSQEESQAEQQTKTGNKQADQEQAPARSPSSFCSGRAAGLYADVEQRCKAYYQCAPTGHQMFRCNNQTQFNQKTQNCDWWYNVDCGGRLGSPEDFEQSPSSQRTRIALADPTDRPNSASDVAPAREDSEQTSSTTPMATTTSGSSSTSSTEQQQQQSQSGSCSDSSSDCGRFGGSQTSSSQNGTSDEQPTGLSSGQPQTDSLAQFGTTNSNHQQDDNLIEVVAATVEPQPRVGAAPTDEMATTTTTGTTTTQIGTETPPTTLGSTSFPATTTTTITTSTLASKQQRQQQISELDEVAAKSRRLIQSEFGGSSKNARAISRARYQESNELPRVELAVGELSSLEGQLEDQLRLEDQKSARMDITIGAQQQQQQQVSKVDSSHDPARFDPHNLSLDNQQELLDTQHSQNPTKRRGILSGSGFTKIKEKHTDTKIGRRFGARLPPPTTYLATSA